MKIIKKGKIPVPITEQNHNCTCWHCDTEFEFQGKEAETTNGTTMTVKCPLCGKINHVYTPLGRSYPKRKRDEQWPTIWHKIPSPFDNRIEIRM